MYDIPKTNEDPIKIQTSSENLNTFRESVVSNYPIPKKNGVGTFFCVTDFSSHSFKRMDFKSEKIMFP